MAIKVLIRDRLLIRKLNFMVIPKFSSTIILTDILMSFCTKPLKILPFALLMIAIELSQHLLQAQISTLFHNDEMHQEHKLSSIDYQKSITQMLLRPAMIGMQSIMLSWKCFILIKWYAYSLNEVAMVLRLQAITASSTESILVIFFCAVELVHVSLTCAGMKHMYLHDISYIFLIYVYFYVTLTTNFPCLIPEQKRAILVSCGHQSSFVFFMYLSAQWSIFYFWSYVPPFHFFGNDSGIFICDWKKYYNQSLLCICIQYPI